MGHYDTVNYWKEVKHWRKKLWRNQPVDAKTVVSRLDAADVRFLSETQRWITKLASFNSLGWPSVEGLGLRIEMDCEDTSPMEVRIYRPLSEALIHGSRCSQDRELELNRGWEWETMCHYCGQPAATGSNTCWDHQARRTMNGRASSGYELLKRLEAWSENIHKKQLRQLLAETCRRVRKEASTHAVAAVMEKEVLDALPRLKRKWRAQKLYEPEGFHDLAAWLGWKKDWLSDLNEMGQISLYSQLILAESWLAIQEDYRAWYPTARAEGGRVFGGAPKKHEEADLQYAIRLRQQGMTLRAIEQQVGISRSTLSRRMRALRQV